VIEMKVDKVGIDPENGMAVVMLKDEAGKRFLPIWIGALEANAIALAMEGVVPPRPLTHDLLKNMLERFQARVTMVLINDLRDDTFYAQITLDSRGETMEIDGRPSDAIALAIRFQAPIFAAEKVIETAAISEEQEPPTVH